MRVKIAYNKSNNTSINHESRYIVKRNTDRRLSTWKTYVAVFWVDKTKHTRPTIQGEKKKWYTDLFLRAVHHTNKFHYNIFFLPLSLSSNLGVYFCYVYKIDWQSESGPY